MKRAKVLQEVRTMRFEGIYEEWKLVKLTQQEAAEILGVCDRTFRRYLVRYEEEGLRGLIDRRLERASCRRAPVDEVEKLLGHYSKWHFGWSVKHYYRWYRQRYGGRRSYSWVKNKLQEGGLVKKAPGRGKHRKRRQRSALEGMMLFQDGSRHQWVEGKQWDLIVTMDDATSEHYSMFFVEEEGTDSSFRGVGEVIEKKGLFCSLYVDRGSHYWNTPVAGGPVDKKNLTQFGRAMRQLGIELIPSYSPQARGRIERFFRTHQERLPRELKLAGIRTMEEANRYLREVYLPAFNQEFRAPAVEQGTAFVPWSGEGLWDILCEQHERVVGNDNCVSFEGKALQIPADRYRMNYVRAKVRVHRYIDGRLAVFHGPRKLAEYDRDGRLMTQVVTDSSVKGTRGEGRDARACL